MSIHVTLKKLHIIFVKHDMILKNNIHVLSGCYENRVDYIS